MADREDSTDVDGLFRLPLHEFTEARNALASKLQKAGRKDEAARVRTTPKPPLSAWVVNQLFWRERPWFEKLLDAAARLRQGHAAGQPGQPASIQGPLKEQREALNQLSRKAAAFLSETGHSANPDVLRRVTQVLQGVAAREGTPDGPRPGRLTSEVAAPGFEVLSGMLARGGGTARDGSGPTRVLAFTSGRGKAGAKQSDLSATAKAAQERTRLAAARRAVLDAERAADKARKAARTAEAEMKNAAATVKDVERERVRAEAALEKTTAAAERARQDARRTASRAAEAAQELDDAERALARARAQLED
jgi:hypothetical protein